MNYFIDYYTYYKNWDLINKQELKRSLIIWYSLSFLYFWSKKYPLRPNKLWKRTILAGTLFGSINQVYYGNEDMNRQIYKQIK
ncbi:hypothetical protein pb186bvf_007709 [Paramecium bursaria]